MNTDKAEHIGESRLYVSKTYKLNGTESPTETTDEKVEVHRFETAPAEVSLEYGLTLNMGNYESCRLTVGIRVPCYKEQVEAAYVAANSWVGAKVAEQAEAIKKSTKLF